MELLWAVNSMEKTENAENFALLYSEVSSQSALARGRREHLYSLPPNHLSTHSLEKEIHKKSYGDWQKIAVLT